MDAGQLFNVDPLESRAAKGHSVVTSMAASNDVFLLGTSKGWIICNDFNHGDSQNLDFAPGRPGEQPMHRVFVDLGGCHCIATVVISGVAETFYVHAKWAKPKSLPRLKGLLVNAIAGNRQLITEDKERLLSRRRHDARNDFGRKIVDAIY